MIYCQKYKCWVFLEVWWAVFSSTADSFSDWKPCKRRKSCGWLEDYKTYSWISDKLSTFFIGIVQYLWKMFSRAENVRIWSIVLNVHILGDMSSIHQIDNRNRWQIKMINWNISTLWNCHHEFDIGNSEFKNDEADANWTIERWLRQQRGRNKYNI